MGANVSKINALENLSRRKTCNVKILIKNNSIGIDLKKRSAIKSIINIINMYSFFLNIIILLKPNTASSIINYFKILNRQENTLY